MEIQLKENEVLLYHYVSPDIMMEFDSDIPLFNFILVPGRVYRLFINGLLESEYRPDEHHQLHLVIFPTKVTYYRIEAGKKLI